MFTMSSTFLNFDSDQVYSDPFFKALFITFHEVLLTSNKKEDGQLKHSLVRGTENRFLRLKKKSKHWILCEKLNIS